MLSKASRSVTAFEPVGLRQATGDILATPVVLPWVYAQFEPGQ